MIRLQKYMASCNVASRRESEKLIQQGVVKVNGTIVTELGFKVSDDDEVEVNGKILKEEKYIYIMLNKPTGYISTAKEQFGRATVLDLINIKERIYPIGRLDYDTSGLLLLTNDGDLTYKLTHPKHDVEKTYIAKVVGEPSAESLLKFQNGLEIEDYVTAKAKIFIVKKEDRYTSLKISIKEGKNRQVRKMCEAIGHKVVTLSRISTGKLFLGDLKKGDYRHLTNEEVEYLKNL